MRGIHVDGALPGDSHALDCFRLPPVSDADAVGRGAVVGDEPGAPFVVPGPVSEADLHAVRELLPVSRDRDARLRRLTKPGCRLFEPGTALRIVGALEYAPRERVRVAIVSVDLYREDAGFGKVKRASHGQVVELLSSVLVGGDLGYGFEHRGVVRELQRRPRLEVDMNGFVDKEQRTMPARPVLMQARLEYQAVVRGGAIDDGLRIVAGPDDMLVGVEKRGRTKDQEERTHERVHGNHR